MTVGGMGFIPERLLMMMMMLMALASRADTVIFCVGGGRAAGGAFHFNFLFSFLTFWPFSSCFFSRGFSCFLLGGPPLTLASCLLSVL